MGCNHTFHNIVLRADILHADGSCMARKISGSWSTSWSRSVGEIIAIHISFSFRLIMMHHHSIDQKYIVIFFQYIL